MQRLDTRTIGKTQPRFDTFQYYAVMFFEERRSSNFCKKFTFSGHFVILT